MHLLALEAILMKMVFDSEKKVSDHVNTFMESNVFRYYIVKTIFMKGHW